MHTNRVLRVAEITGLPGLQEASVLYREVFGYTAPEANLNPRLLMAIAHNGGSMVGAWDVKDHLVGFGYGFPGRHRDENFFYSQAVVVADGLQGTGVGRRIKAEQRRLALAAGLHRMRWAFNPALSRNAHFNLSVLGATGRWFDQDYYGDGESRMVVDWDLDASIERPTPDLPPLGWGEVRQIGECTAIGVPADATQVTPELAAALDQVLSQAFATGLVATGCHRVDPSSSVYTFEADA